LWKEKAAAKFEVISWNLPGETEEKHRDSMKAAGPRAETSVPDFPNKRQE
jgi:hypothetical protein